MSEWSCNQCTYLNTNTSQCEMCYNINPNQMKIDDNQWKCLFCTSSNESASRKCYICNKANTDIVNINKVCLCGEEVSKYHQDRTQCRLCCKVGDKPQSPYYDCKSKQCTFEEVTGDYYFVCSKCYNDTNKATIDSNHTFLFCKFVSMMDQIKNEVKKCKDNNEKRRYMSSVYWLLYLECIAKFEERMNESEYKEIKDTFNVFYDDAMDEIQKNIDHEELGLRRDIFVNKTNLNKAQWDKMKEISVKWHTLNEEHKIDGNKVDSSDVCCDSKKCQTRKRIQFVLDIYNECFLKQFADNNDDDNEHKCELRYVQIFQSAFDEYDAIQLLNDFFHIQEYHENDEQLNNCIYDRDDDDNDDNICSSTLWRNRRESRHSRKKEKRNDDDAFINYVKQMDKVQINILEISSKIHMMINHTANRQKKGETYKQVNCSKFINEIIECKDKSDGKDIEIIAGDLSDELAEDLNANGLAIKRCNALMNSFVSEEYDTDAVIDDLTDYNNNDICNEYKQSQIYQIFLQKKTNDKYFIKRMKKYFNITPNDDDKVTAFVLGRCEVYYWKHFKQFDCINYADKPRYASIKEECTNNAIHSIDMETFYELLQNAVTYTHSNKGKTLKAKYRRGENSYLEIPFNLPISISHILTLMMYCNFSDLQSKYKKEGCREKNKDETIEEFVKRNKEIGHWYKLLRQAIEFYGSEVKQHQVFYTGINAAVSFVTYTPRFYCPFSTTIEWNVANTFSEGQGIILKLEPDASSHDTYFNVEWLSNYPNERERLFCRGMDLMITDIQYVYKKEIQNNTLYLNAFRLFSAIFAGHYLIRKESDEETLLCLIINYKENNGINNKNNVDNIHIPIYIQQLFYHLVHHLGKTKYITTLLPPMRIIPSQYMSLNKLLQSELLSLNPISLFPFLQSLDIKASDIECVQEYNWSLSDKQLQELKYGQKDIKSQQYSDKTATFVFGLFQTSRDITLNLEIKDLSSSSSSRVSAKFSIAIDQLNYVTNSNDMKLSQGQNKGIQLFERKSLENKLLDLTSLTLKISLIFEQGWMRMVTY